MEETTINNNNMEEKLILNSIEDAEIISVRLSPDETPIAYENRVRCLMLSGLSREEAEKVALEPMDLELYYEIGVGLLFVIEFWRGRDGAIMSCLRTIQTQRFINARETDTSARIRGSISTSGQTRSSRTRKCR